MNITVGQGVVLGAKLGFTTAKLTDPTDPSVGWDVYTSTGVKILSGAPIPEAYSVSKLVYLPPMIDGAEVAGWTNLGLGDDVAWQVSATCTDKDVQINLSVSGAGISWVATINKQGGSAGAVMLLTASEVIKGPSVYYEDVPALTNGQVHTATLALGLSLSATYTIEAMSPIEGVNVTATKNGADVDLSITNATGAAIAEHQVVLFVKGA